MKSNIVIADTGVIISLTIIDQLSMLKIFFNNIFIPDAVWNELNKISGILNIEKAKLFFKNKIRTIKRKNDLISFMDYGESEAIILYEEMNADFLLIDDKHGRKVAESKGIQCVGTLGLLLKAKELNYINELRPFFILMQNNNRFFQNNLLNALLKDSGEELL